MTTTITSSGTYNVSSDTVDISADAITVAVAGTQDVIGVSGINNSVTVGTYYDNADGNQVNVAGTDNFVSVLEGFDGVINVNGTNNIVEVHGFYDTISISGASSEVSLAGYGHDVTISTSNSQLSLYAYSDIIDVDGDGGNISFFQRPLFGPDGQNQITVAGNNNTLSFAAGSNTVTLTASNTSLNISGDNTNVQLAGSNDILTLTGSNETVNFQGSKSILQLQDPASFTGSITNMSLGDTIDLAGISVSGVSYDGSTLTVSESNSAQLSFTISGNLNGDAVNFASDGNGGTDIGWVQPPAVTQVAAVPSTGDEGISATIPITLTFNDAVNVTGPAPTLTLNDGGTAIYTGGSGTNALTFVYTVGAENSSVSALAITGVTNQASVTDSYGNAADFTAADTTFNGLQIDTQPPQLLSLTQTGPSLTNASVVNYTAAFSEAVTGVDASQFSLNDSGATGASISSVTPVSGGNGTQYTIAIDTGTGNGSVGLNFIGANVRDLAGNEIAGGSFSLQSTIPVGTDANGVSAADLTGNGREDLIVLGQDTISLLLSNGDGTYQSPVTYAVGSQPGSVAVGDLTGNGIQDIVVSNYSGAGTVSVLMGNGDGTFQPQVTYATGGYGYPATAKIADINGDGKPDLVISNNNWEGGVAVLLGNGDGTFQAPIVSDLNDSNAISPSGLAVGNINGGQIVAVGNYFSNDVNVFLANSDGTLSLLETLSASGPEQVTLAELTGNGKQDLIFANYNSNTVDIALGNGDGTFQPEVSYAVGTNPAQISVADVNGDGIPDIVVTNSDHTVSVLLGNGNGTFQPATTETVGANATGVTVADMNGDGRPDLVVAGGNTNTLSILDNAPSQITAASYIIDKTPPAVSQVAASPSTGDEGIGKTVPITLTFSKPVTVTGAAPALALNDGGTAGYISGSGTNTLTFSYTVGAENSSTSALAITSVTNAASVTDAAGNAADFTAAETTFNDLQIDTQTPQLLSLTQTGLSLTNASVVNYTATFSETVTGVDASQFSLTDTGVTGASIASVTPVAGSNGTQYAIAVNTGTGSGTLSVALKGGGVADLAGNRLPLNLSFQTPQTYSDGGTPTFGVIADLNNGKADLVMGNYSGNVSVFLGNGDGTLQAPVTYQTGSDSETVSVGDLTGSGIQDIVTENGYGDQVAVLLGNGDGTFKPTQYYNSGIGYLNQSLIANLSGPGKPADIIVGGESSSAPQASYETAVLMGNGDGTFQAAKIVAPYTGRFTVADLTGNGIQDLIETDAANNNVIVYLGNGDGTFQPGTSFAAGPSLEWVAAADLTGNGIQDLVVTNYSSSEVSVLMGNGNGTFQAPVTYSTGAGTTPGNLSIVDLNGDGIPDIVTGNDSGGVSILLGNGDGTFQAPVVNPAGYASRLTAGDLNGDGKPDLVTANFFSQTIDVLTNNSSAGVSGQVYTIDKTPPAVSQVAASPSTGDEGIGATIPIALTLSKPVTVSGAGPVLQLNDGGTAAYQSISSDGKTLTFAYTVGSGDTSESSLAITNVTNGSLVTDAAGNAANFAPAVTTFAGLQIDTVVPAITSIMATPLSGHEEVGSTITIAVAFSEAVSVTGGTPTLSLNDGGTATYASGSGTNTLTFTYKVGAGDTSLPALAVTGLNPMGATIADAAGNAATVSGAAKTFGGLQIDTVTPVITQVATTPASGDIGLGKKVTVTLAFDKAVTVKGTPKLTLNDGGSATYTSGSGTAALTFTYTVAAGQNTTDLQATGITLPSGASIKDSSGDTADLTGAKVNLGLQIDSVTPAVSAINSSPSSGDLNAGKTVAISLAMSEPVVVTGAPTLTLNDGGTAAFTGASGNTLNFTYAVVAGQNTASLSVTKLNVPTGASILDAAGNKASTTLPASAALGIQIDTKAPTATASASAGTTDLNAGKTAEITLTMSESVTVSGTPTLSLNDGGSATYDAGLSSATSLTFDYTVAAGQNTTALNITGLTGGSIQDLAGNALATVPGNSLGLQVDTTAPTVTKVTSSPASGTVSPTTSPTPTITLKMSEAVTVSGTPELLLSNGGTANYNAASSTSTSLAFTYTPSSPQSTTALSVIGLELSSPSAIVDGAGNAATLSGAAATLGVKVNAGGTGSPAPIAVSGTSDAEIFGASSQNVTFASGADGTLKLDAAQSFTGKVSGLGLGDTLDLANVAFGPNTTVGYSGTAAGGTLTVTSGSQTANIVLLGNYMASTFTLGSDGHGGTTVVDPPKIAAAPLAANPHSLHA